MAEEKEELKSLIDRIQKEGVEKAETEGRHIVDKAEQQADEIRRKAEEEAESKKSQAEQEAESFRARGEDSLRQTARDVLLTVGQALDGMLLDVAKAEVGKTLAGEALTAALGTAIEGYFRAGGGAADLDVLVDEKQKEPVKAYLAEAFAERLKEGMEVKADASIVAGFRLAARDTKVEHDFSQEALAELFAKLLRPRMAKIVRQAVEKTEKAKEGDPSTGSG